MKLANTLPDIKKALNFYAEQFGINDPELKAALEDFNLILEKIDFEEFKLNLIRGCKDWNFSLRYSRLWLS